MKRQIDVHYDINRVKEAFVTWEDSLYVIGKAIYDLLEPLEQSKFDKILWDGNDSFEGTVPITERDRKRNKKKMQRFIQKVLLKKSKDLIKVVTSDASHIKTDDWATWEEWEDNYDDMVSEIWQSVLSILSTEDLKKDPTCTESIE